MPDPSRKQVPCGTWTSPITADVVADYYAGYGELGDGGYVAGDLIEVLDGQRRPRCLIRATRV